MSKDVDSKDIDLKDIDSDDSLSGGDIKDKVDDVAKGKKPKGDELKYTDADIDRIVNEKFAKWQSKKEAEIDEAKKLAEMNAQEKAEFERDKIQAELLELRKAQAKSEMFKVARVMLKEKHLDVSDELIGVLVVEDAEETKANVEGFAKAFQVAVDKAVLEKIKNPNDKRGVVSTITAKEIMGIKDTRLRQEKIKENMHLFE